MAIVAIDADSLLRNFPCCSSDMLRKNSFCLVLQGFSFVFCRGGEVGELGRAWLVFTSFSHTGVLPVTIYSQDGN